jgi:hypothetical protein
MLDVFHCFSVCFLCWNSGCFPPAEQIFVKKVDAGSWAAQHGLREGFQLLKAGKNQLKAYQKRD